MTTRAELVKNAGKIKPDEASNASNPKVYFDIKIGNIKAGRITFEVGQGHVKVVAANYRAFRREFLLNASFSGIFVLLHFRGPKSKL